VDPLISALHDDQAIRGEAARALGKIGNKRAADALLHVLVDEQAATRSAAAWALGEIKDTRAVDPLAAMVTTDGVPSVRDTAAHSLIRLGDARGIPRGVPALVARMRLDTRRPVPNFGAICELLVPVGAPAVAPLITLLQHEDEDVQEVAARTLAQLGDATAVRPLIALLEHGKTPMRRVAADALARLGGTRAVEALVTVLGDTDAHLRQASANLLSRSGPRAVEPLIAALSDDDPILRREAAKVLAALRDARAVDPLIEATRDPSEDVRWAAGNALLLIGERKAMEPLVQLLISGDVVPTGYFQSLLGTLRRASHAVPVETLLELARLSHVLGPATRVDCSEYREFAQQELGRRGIQV
jgi:HEAT repeat protein